MGENVKHTPGAVSQLPWHDGDGYSWGGDVIVSFGERAINLGNSTHSGETLSLARLIAAAPDLLEAAKATRSLVAEAAMVGFNFNDGDWADRLYRNQANLSAAIAKAEYRP